ncbi:MAG: hypothetical protein TR69_WS6001000907 [candidate division WS6 bacterium OLB20]|uniref:Uncharacterized protein n=1 Tax=candidate division WS6 bacterium OLB20 TaxID=1617426 RepID=A0A136LYY8_9BACT|nr:MAG: hypothetical protein TR69_WS6001000907 [candidate division WS6 bacterium OLB20]
MYTLVYTMDNVIRNDVGIETTSRGVRSFHKRIMTGQLGTDFCRADVVNDDGTLSLNSRFVMDLAGYSEMTAADVDDLTGRYLALGLTGSERHLHDLISKDLCTVLEPDTSGRIIVTAEQIENMRRVIRLWDEALQNYHYLTSTREGVARFREMYAGFRLDETRRSMLTFLARRLADKLRSNGEED